MFEILLILGDSTRILLPQLLRFPDIACTVLLTSVYPPRPPFIDSSALCYRRIASNATMIPVRTFIIDRCTP